ncbi:MAG: Uma2 family endonuclease [Caldilineaceae bacterium]
MTIATQPSPAEATVIDPPTIALPQGYHFRRFSVDEYHAMARAGVLAEDDNVELLEGWLVHKMTKNPPHTATTRYTRAALDDRLPPGYFVDSQEPITLSQSEPEPDVFVVRGTLAEYKRKHPQAKDVVLVVEVADSSLEQDRTTKKRVYARDGLPVYWIANLVEEQVEVYTQPSGPVRNPDYRSKVVYQRDDLIPVVIDEKTVALIKVADILP